MSINFIKSVILNIIMDEKEYLESLDKAYSELPEVLYKKGRFEVPKVTGKLIRSRTIINNFKEIAKILSRDENHLLKYFLKEAGVRGEIDNRGELVLHSRFQPASLNNIVETYFKNFIECTHCRSPDTTMSDDYTKIVCKACGHEAGISRI